MAEKGTVAGFSAEELAGLSEEERTALIEGEAGDEADADALREIAGEGGDDAESGDDTASGGGDGDEDGGDGDQGNEEGEGDAAASGQDDEGDAADGKGKKAVGDGGDAAAEAAADADADDEAAPVNLPRYVAPPVENYDAQVKGLNDEQAKLLTDYKTGDIEDADFNAKQADRQGRREVLLSAKLKGEFSSEFNEQMARQQWLNEVDYFLRTVKKDEGIDYRAKGNEKFNTALDNAVKVLAADRENKDWTGEQFLTEAHEIVKARFKLSGRDAADGDYGGKPAPKKGEGKPPVKPPSRKPDLKAVPKTLGGLPAAGDEEAGADPEFSHLVKLAGIELENAVATMTPAQQDRWARGSR
jgi:hypothetical protein